LGRSEEAIRYGTLAVQSNPAFIYTHLVLVVSLAAAGRLDAARAAAKRMQDIGRYSISDYLRAGFFQPERMEQLAAWLREAGVPE
jgi:hypothetical protein